MIKTTDRRISPGGRKMIVPDRPPNYTGWLTRASQGGVATSLAVIIGLMLLIAAGGMMNGYIKTQVMVPEQEIQKTFSFTAPTETSAVGEHQLQFTASDGIDTFTSDPVTVIVTAKNAPPKVSAGEDIQVRLPREAELSGTMSDDGLPIGPTEVTVVWSKVSGPGDVTFGASNSLETTAGFTLPGTYVLRLTADDGKASAQDDITITAEAAPNSPNLSLKSDRSKLEMGGQVAVYAEITEATPFANWALFLDFDQTVLELVDQQSGDFDTFIADTRGLATINSSSEIRSGGFSLTNNNSGQGKLGIFIFKAVGVGETTITTANKSDSRLFGNILTETDSYEILPTIVVGELHLSVLTENTPPAVTAGADQQIRLPTNEVMLSGVASDDGLPEPPATVTVEWTKVSGPGTVTFNEPTSLTTAASFSTTGVYILQLSASDSTLTSVDEVIITVKDENRAPLAIGDKYFAWQSETLNVSVAEGVLINDTDIDNDPLSAQLVSNVQHGELALSPNGSFYYVPEKNWRGTDSFSYQAFDGLAVSGEAVVEINVGVRNTAPVVQAGDDQVISLPNPVILLGSVQDDGEPVGQGLQIKWHKISSPGTVVFTDDSNVSTSATFSEPGDYVISLEVSDGELTTTDEVAIKINTVPNGQSDSFEAFQFEQLLVEAPGVLGNDHDNDGNALTAQLVASTKHGQLQLAADGSFSYTSDKFYTGTDSFTYVASDGHASSTVVTAEIIVTMRNAPPVTNAGSDLIVEWGEAVQLDGIVTDDGQPEAIGKVNVMWGKISGPGEVTFANYNQATTTAHFSVAGQYTLRLSANDGEKMAADEITITAHTAPQVAAGNSLQPLINETVQLNGAVSDDGLPTGTSPLSVEWTMVSGPSESIEFKDKQQAVTETVFRQEGSYVLRLTAHDGHLTTWDEVAVQVVSRQASVAIPGQTRLEARPGQTIEVPFVVKSNILNRARLLLKMTANIYFSEIK